ELEKLLKDFREKGNRQQQTGEEFQQKILGAQQTQNRLQPHRQRPDSEIDGGHDEKTEHHTGEEGQEVEQARGAPQGVNEHEHQRYGQAQHASAKQGLPECLGDVHELNVDRLDEVHGQFAFDDLVGHVLVNVVEVKRTDDPTHRDVSVDMAEVEAFDGGTVFVNGLPDEVIDRDVDEVGYDARVVAQAVGERVDEPHADELRIDPPEAPRRRHPALPCGRMRECAGAHHPTSPLR